MSFVAAAPATTTTTTTTTTATTATTTTTSSASSAPSLKHHVAATQRRPRPRVAGPAHARPCVLLPPLHPAPPLALSDCSDLSDDEPRTSTITQTPVVPVHVPAVAAMSTMLPRPVSVSVSVVPSGNGKPVLVSPSTSSSSSSPSSSSAASSSSSASSSSTSSTTAPHSAPAVRAVAPQSQSQSQSQPQPQPQPQSQPHPQPPRAVQPLLSAAAAATTTASPPPAAAKPLPAAGGVTKKARLAKRKAPGESRYWTASEHKLFVEALLKHGPKNLKAISAHVGTRNMIQCRTHEQKYFLRLMRKAQRETMLRNGELDHVPDAASRPLSHQKVVYSLPSSCGISLLCAVGEEMARSLQE